jgi:hypothetical protein
MKTKRTRFFYITYKVNKDVYLVNFIVDFRGKIERRQEVNRNPVVESMTACLKPCLEGKKVIQAVVTFKKTLSASEDFFRFGDFCPTNIEALEYPEVALRFILKHFEADSQPSSNMLYSTFPLVRISAFFGKRK